MQLVDLVFFLIIVVLFFFIMRSVNLWYWRINHIIETLERIEKKL